MQIVLHDPRVERGFIGAQRAYYWSGGSFGDAPRDRAYARLGTRIENRAGSRQGLNATLDRFEDTGKEIYFVQQVRELGFDPREWVRVRPINVFTPVRSH